MAGAIVQSAYTVDDVASASTQTATLTGVTAGNTLVCFTGWSDSAGTRTCTVSDGATYTSAAAKVSGGTDVQASQVFILENVQAGSHAVVMTLNSAAQFRRIRVIEVSGLVWMGAVDKSARAQQNIPGTTANAISSGASAATLGSFEFVLGLTQNTTQSDPGTGTLTAGTGYTISGTNLILGIESKSITVNAAQTATFTQSVNNSHTTHVLTLKVGSIVRTKTSTFGDQPMLRGPM